MKKITLLFCTFIALSLFACTKTGTTPLPNPDPKVDLYKNVPSSPVPPELANGIWFSGTLSAISYFDRDGHQLHHDYEAGREYQFSNVNGKGRIKFWQYLGTKGFSSCATEYFTYKEVSESNVNCLLCRRWNCNSTQQRKRKEYKKLSHFKNWWLFDKIPHLCLP